jgi:hypothetical protein
MMLAVADVAAAVVLTAVVVAAAAAAAAGVVGVGVVEGGDGASKRSLPNLRGVYMYSTCINGCFASLFYKLRTSPIIYAQNVWSYSTQINVVSSLLSLHNFLSIISYFFV